MSLFPGFLGGLQKIVAILFAPTLADPTIDTGTPAISYRTDLDRLRLQDVAGNMHSLAHVDDLDAYTPGDAGDWAGTPPTTISDALDRIAAGLGPIA